MQLTHQRQRVFIFIFGILFAISPAYCINTYFVATDGNDSSTTGDINHPYKTINKGVSMVAAGDTLYVRGGTYAYTGSSTAITLSVSGTSPNNRCSLIGYNGERPLVDFSAMTGTGADGLKINGSY